MTAIFLNGRFVQAGEAMLPAFDAGFQHGIGLFETMTGGVSESGPWIFMLEAHIERLERSARELGLSVTLRAPALADAAIETVRRSGLSRSRVRLTITGGDLNMLASGRDETAPREHHPTVLVSAQPATNYPAEMFERGVAVVIADYKTNPLDPFAGHKTLNYWPRLRELQIAAGRRAAEALIFQVTNHLAGGCVSNAILVKDDRLLTPIARGEEAAGTPPGSGAGASEPVTGAVMSSGGGSGGVAIPSPVLPGIMREWVLEWANENRIPVVRRMLTIDDVLGADEVLLTNSSWGVLPVVKVEAEAIGVGIGGPIGKELVAAWGRSLEDAADAM